MNQELISRRAATADVREGIPAPSGSGGRQEAQQQCRQTRSVDGTEYPPCARAAGHEEAYCRSVDGQAYFLAAPGPRRAGSEEQPQTPEADLIGKAVAALQAKAGELSELAEEEMRPSLEEQAQVWHEAADMVRRVARKAAHRD